MDEQQKAFMAFLELKVYEDDNFIVDFEDILNVLDQDLPMIPGVPMVQANPNPFLKKEDPIRVTFGKLMPKEKKDKDGDKKKAAAKKPAAKKDEKPPKPIMWEGEKRPAPSTTLDLVRNAVSSYNQPVFPKNLKQDSCNTGVMPFIIKEVFMPPDAP